MMKRTFAALALTLALAAPAAAETLTPTSAVERHMKFAGAGDIAALAGDYADDAVILLNGQATQGRPAIQAMFQKMLGGGPGKGPQIKPTKVWAEGDVGFVTWEMGPVKGEDCFLVRNGKIQVQAVWMQGGPPAQP